MNQFEKKIINVKELPSGDNLSITLYRITGAKPGPHVHIQASVHGAEVQGNLVIMELLQHFSRHPINGSITLIPMANPHASNTKFGTLSQGRYNPITGNNWNRNYSDLSDDLNISEFAREHQEASWSEIKNLYKKHILETCNKVLTKLSSEHIHVSENKKLNLLLQKIASTADIVLDLHTGPKACRYLYSAEYQKDVAPDLLAPFTLIIPNEFAGAMDEACFVPWVKLQQELQGLGRQVDLDVYSFTIELGSEEIVDSHEAKADAGRILYFLYRRGILAENLVTELIPGKWSELANYSTYYAPMAGLFEATLKPGTSFNKGDVLGIIHRPRAIESLDKIAQASYNVLALNDGVVINHTPTAIVGEGMELIQILGELKEWS